MPVGLPRTERFPRLGIADRQKRELFAAPHVCRDQKSNPLFAFLSSSAPLSPESQSLVRKQLPEESSLVQVEDVVCGELPEQGPKSLCCHSRKDCGSTALALPCNVLNVMPWRFLKLSSQPWLAMKSGMCISSASFIAFSLIRSPPTGRFCPLTCFSNMSSPSSSFGL
ncbi:hypothetical protein FHG87_006358 [Trinorchestia longiramus]|nr:hypothetical protein FHG87_006358 [Trinorchestia longiramus]